MKSSFAIALVCAQTVAGSGSSIDEDMRRSDALNAKDWYARLATPNQKDTVMKKAKAADRIENWLAEDWFADLSPERANQVMMKAEAAHRTSLVDMWKADLEEVRLMREEYEKETIRAAEERGEGHWEDSGYHSVGDVWVRD